MDPQDADIRSTEYAPRHYAQASRPIRCTLKVLSGADQDQQFAFDLNSETKRPQQIVCGRGDDCDVVLNDASVSTHHAEIIFEGKTVRVRDLDSRNGVWIGQARIEEAWLGGDAQFFIGDCLVAASVTCEQVPITTRTTLGTMQGKAESTRAMFSVIERVARTPMTVLVMGESGTGKGEVARTLHTLSNRRGPFQVLDCGTMPPELAASMVLGHAKGAFTGATSDRKGTFEVANGGTVFLDEIGELPLELQPHLLTVVDRGELQRVGETQTRNVDVRIVAATNRDLAADVESGRFRRDLYMRLRQYVIHVTPLRDRKEDIVFLAEQFLQEFSQKTGSLCTLDDTAKKALRQMHWHGNVRQLKDAMRRVAYLAHKPTVTVQDLILFDDDLPASTVAAGAIDLAAGGLREQVRTFETRFCERAVQEAGGDLTVAAKAAGYTLQGFMRLLDRLGLGHLIRK